MAGSASTDGLAREGPPPLHARTADEALLAQGSHRDGLDPAEARRRLAEHGPNELPRAAGEGPLRVLWRQIDNPLIWVLLGAAAVALLLGKITDGLVVLAVVVLNAVIGFVQEYRASKAIEALGSMVAETATVIRGGERHAVPAPELVPGDVVLLASGDRVPADVRLLAAKGLLVQEAALTGESVPTEKGVAPVEAEAAIGDRTCLGFGGTLVTSGTGTGLVIATGGATELGRISELLGQTVTLETPLTRALGKIGRAITVGVVGVSAILVGVALVRGFTVADALLVAISLAVAAIPEGLPAIVTIALAIGVQRMAARRAIVRKLPAVETLGSTTVICTDKTGTLTRNEMTVQACWTPRGRYRLEGVGYEPHGAIRSDGGAPVDRVPDDLTALVLAGALCNDAVIHRDEGVARLAGDPTEGALVVAAEKAGLDVAAAREGHRRVDTFPFESEHGFMATLHEGPEGRRRLILKGAPERVLGRTGDRALADRVHGEVERLAAGGMRVLAVAEREVEGSAAHVDLAVVDAGGFRLLGLEGMVDPPRPEAIAAVRACRTAGMRVKMITGDHRITAEAIARELGLGDGAPARTGAEISHLDDAAFARAAHDSHVFARVAPEDKLRLVRALQAEGQVVAMTGDGVNDAPALKRADIGVAMAITGTSVARESADVVLTDDNFASIVAAVEEGRRVWDNLVKALAFVLPTSLGLALILVAAVLAFPFETVDGERVPLLPMLPKQILWINLVSAVALSLPLAFEVAEPDVMLRPPREPRAPVLGRFVVVRTFLVAALMAAGAIGLFLWEYRAEVGRVGHEQALREARTMAVTTVFLFQAFYLWLCRSLRDPLRTIGFFSNRIVFVGIGAMALLQAAFIWLPPLQRIFETAPLSPRALGISAAVAFAIVPVITLEKAWRRRARRLEPARAR